MKTRRLIEQVKKTHVGSAAAWLLRPKKHMEDVERHLTRQLPYPPTRQQIRWCFWDYFRFSLLYRGQLDTDYFGAQMYRKSDLVRRESLAHGERYAWRDRIQAPAHRDIFLDKREFCRAFSDVLGRKWLSADNCVDQKALAEFLNGCGERVCSKHPLGYGGKSVRFWDVRSDADRQALIELWEKEPLIVEEVLSQSEDLYTFSGCSVNTMRMITLVDRDRQAHVARSEFRMGRSGMEIDNFSSGGLVAQVDVESGVIFTPGRDENGREYIFHPDSGKQIVGFRIPEWEAYRQFVCALAERFPDVRYVGWDVIRNREGQFCVVEGNKDAGVGGLESGLLYGLRPGFEAILNNIRIDDR